MDAIKAFLLNFGRFLNFWFGLLLCKKLACPGALEKKRIIFTPLRGCENCWVDYYLAVRLDKVANVEVVMMTPNAIPFGNAENNKSHKAKLYCVVQCIKHYLVRIVLTARSVKYTTVNKLPEPVDSTSEVARLSADEFFRRFYGDRNYDKLIHEREFVEVLSLFQSLYEYVSKSYRDTDILVSSHGIYEWAVCYSFFQKVQGKALIWGANIYNSQVLRVSGEPLQVGRPLGAVYDDCLLDIKSRFAGSAIDQPKQWDKQLDSNIIAFMEKHDRIALLAPNCLWDGDTDVRDSIYKGVLDWVEDTLDFAFNNRKLGVIIRVHPAEATMWSSRPSLWKVLNQLQLPENCFVIGPEDASSTLDVSGLSDVTVFYSGMVGVEANALGHSVVCVSSSLHGKLKGVFQVDSIDKYHQLLSGSDVDVVSIVEGHLSIDDLFNRGLRISCHPGSNVTMFTNPGFRGYMDQPYLDAFFLEHITDIK